MFYWVILGRSVEQKLQFCNHLQPWEASQSFWQGLRMLLRAEPLNVRRRGNFDSYDGPSALTVGDPDSGGWSHQAQGHEDLENELMHDASGSQEPTMIYGSEVMQAVCRFADRAARTLAKVLITGESGVGKDLLARRIHARSSPRFQAFHCNQLCRNERNAPGVRVLRARQRSIYGRLSRQGRQAPNWPSPAPCFWMKLER